MHQICHGFFLVAWAHVSSVIHTSNLHLLALALQLASLLQRSLTIIKVPVSLGVQAELDIPMPREIGPFTENAWGVSMKRTEKSEVSNGIHPPWRKTLKVFLT